MSNILITGASGFIGSFIVEEAISKGYNVYAAIRATSSKKYLTDSRINFIELDFANKENMNKEFSKIKASIGKFDYIVHCAGVTKCINKKEFYDVNYLQTKQFIDCLIENNMVPDKFVNISSLSVYGPIREKNYTPINITDTPQPNTEYGKSKLMAERYIESITDFPYITLRPTGVYGPRERDYFLMAKSIKNHIDFIAGLKRQDLTFIYVKDVVQAVFCAIESNIIGRSYFISDGNVYESQTFSELIKKELGNPFLIRIKCPLFVLKAISFCAEKIAKLQGKTSTLNMDKYKIMKQRNWRCDITNCMEDINYYPKYDLERGVKETINWYKENKWL